ncbi:phage integrase SAM-like domain-containing protein [Robinsoniella sp. RHS]|uniref:phage integrase SAM-like domain-containing protein n=1 Tax=Robinsoniella sp. RHS TaxID=1504536 RepID=UPI00374FE074
MTDQKHLSIRKFRFDDCTHDFLLDYIAFLKYSGCAERTCNNRLAALRAYLWYAADRDISLQSIALTASKVPFLRVLNVSGKQSERMSLQHCWQHLLTQRQVCGTEQ